MFVVHGFGSLWAVSLGLPSPGRINSGSKGLLAGTGQKPPTAAGGLQELNHLQSVLCRQILDPPLQPPLLEKGHVCKPTSYCRAEGSWAEVLRCQQGNLPHTGNRWEGNLVRLSSF